MLVAVIDGVDRLIHEELIVMRMGYKIEDNILWITDHRNQMRDFDLQDFKVEIKNVEKQVRQIRLYDKGADKEIG
nr:hypothetical protein [Treponema sp.]